MSVSKIASKIAPGLGKQGRTTDHEAADALILDIDKLERRALALGFYITSRALNRAKNGAGWELAGDIKQAHRAAAKGDGK